MTDIDTLEQEAKSMRARMERLEEENAALKAENQQLKLEYLAAETQAGEHFGEVQRLRAELKQVVEERNAP